MKAILRTSMLIALAAAGGAACSTTRAATPVERPALEVPPPPPRVITALPPPPLPSPEPLPELAPIPNGTTSRPRPQSKPAEPAKPETKPEPPPAEQTAPPPATPQQQPLRIPETTDPTQLANQIKASISNAKAILANTHYGPLSDGKKKAYRDAQLFAQQAEDALKVSNLVYAKELAEKAERLAKELQGR